MVLIFSTQHERYTDEVELALYKDRIKYRRFNLDIDSLKDTLISYSLLDIEIIQNKERFLLSEVELVWIKKRNIHISHKDEKENGGFKDDINFTIWKDEWNFTIRQIFFFLESRNIEWVDNPMSLTQAAIKSRQLRYASEVGFNVPRTLISNNKESILKFITYNKETIVKLATQPAFYVDNDIYFMYTNKIKADDIKNYDDFINNPSIFQQYIDKKYEVRYTYVNGSHFPCKIESQLSDISKVDWRRYDLKQTPYTMIHPSEEIKGKVVRFMQKINLNYGALDFIIDNEDNWWFLEINSVGQYGWIEQLTGMPITQAIVDYIKSKILV